MILLGTALLLLPYATTGGISLTDALFTATSAVCVTGLTVKDTLTDFTTFGKVVILLLIQIGGLGYMSMATLLALLIGRKIGLSERILIKESLNIATFEGIIRFMKGMLVFVFLAEGLGALILSLRFMRDTPLKDAVFKGIFHSVSAFNNAGFSLFQDSLIRFRGDVTVNVTVMSLIVLGGIGFLVVDDIYGRLRKKQKKLMLHTLIVLVSTGLLTAAGAFLFYFNERKYLFARSGPDSLETVLTSLFASVTARTAGFNTIDYSALQPATIFLTIILMLIGASPGSTGGGIKTTTFTVVIMNLWCTIKGRKDTVMFKRRVPEALISRSFVVLAIAVIFINIITLVIIDIEHTGFQKTMFEVVSAFGTVGLSTGDGGSRSFCATFSGPSKIIIIFTMLAGRLGPLTLFMALLGQREERIRYPEGRIMIG
ncbi:MAG: potassium transporter [Nitrospirae bacterium]|nr:potassium transporter [Nitrospirota bacterium]